MTVYIFIAVRTVFKDCFHCCQDRFSDSVVIAVRNIVYESVVTAAS